MPRKKSKRHESEWKDALAEFLLVKQVEGRAPRTLEDHEKHVIHFFTCFPDAVKSHEDLRKCVFSYLSEPVAVPTRNLRLTYLKAFFKWCIGQGYLPGNPMAGIKKMRDKGVVEPGCSPLRQRARQSPYRSLVDEAV